MLVAVSFTAGASTTASRDAATVAHPNSVAAAVEAPAPPPDPNGARPDDTVTPNAVPSAASPAELQYVPITPCRVVDTRTGGGKFAAGETREYYVAGTFGISLQGGKTGGCGIPEGATAVAATVHALNVSGTGGYVRAWPSGQPEPEATVMRYGSLELAVGTTLSMRSGAGKDLLVKNRVASANIVVDVNGYFVPQMWAYISSIGTVIDQSGRLVSVTKTGTGVYTLVWDRDISICAGFAGSDISGYIESVYTSGNTAYVYVYNNAGTAADYWANVTITC
ncbi:hypothetical protein [Microbacterium jejuense]|uniref:hypothetical protein n=1 Tax=Microbacterium jejuense TaxID=1263637 RepID=UPI0031E6D00D